MRRRLGLWGRRLILVLAVLFFLKSFLGAADAASVSGFLLCGGLWYWLTWRKTRELDSPAPRRPFSGAAPPPGKML